MTKLKKAYKAKRLSDSIWRKACAFDGLDPKTAFPVFSNNNPYANPLDRARRLFGSFGVMLVVGAPTAKLNRLIETAANQISHKIKEAKAQDRFCNGCGCRLPQSNVTGYCDLVCLPNDDDDSNFFGGPNHYDQ